MANNDSRSHVIYFLEWFPTIPRHLRLGSVFGRVDSQLHLGAEQRHEPGFVAFGKSNHLAFTICLNYQQNANQPTLSPVLAHKFHPVVRRDGTTSKIIFTTDNQQVMMRR